MLELEAVIPLGMLGVKGAAELEATRVAQAPTAVGERKRVSRRVWAGLAVETYSKGGVGKGKS